MTLLRCLWLVLPLFLMGCDGSGPGKGFPADHCTTDCVTGKERLQIVPAQVTLIPGSSQQLHVLLFDSDEDETGQEITENLVWQSASTGIATVDAQGRVGGVAAGSTQVSVRLGTLQASVPVKVLNAAITALSVVPAYQLSVPGLSHQYQALATVSGGLRVDVTNSVTWSVSQAAVASVNERGLVSSLAVGRTEIRASLYTFVASAHLQVLAPTQASLRVVPAEQSTPAGTAVLFEARLQVGERELDVTEQVRWSSANPAIAAFEAPSTPGLASAKAQGSVVVSATLSYQGQALTAGAQLAVTSAQVTGLRVTPASLSLPSGTLASLRAIASFSDGSSKDVTLSSNWVSANPAIAEVLTLSRNTGVVLAVSPGATQVTASFAGFSGAAAVTVTNAKLLALELQPQSATLVPDLQLNYHLMAHFSDGSRRDVTSAALFSSSEPDVAVIENGDEAGLATAISAGVSTISASYQDQQVSVPLTVVAENVTPESLSVTPVQAELLVGSQLQYRALLTLSNGDQQDVTKSVRWETSNATVAAIDKQGLVLGGSIGSASIGAYLPLRRSASLTATAQLQVVQSAIVALHLLPASKLGVPGMEQQYTALAELASGSLIDVSDQVIWSVSDSNVATMDANGLLVTKAAGAAKVGATLGAHLGVGQATEQGSAALRVVDSNTVALAISPSSTSMPVGTGQQFTAQLIVGEQRLDVTNQVIWRSGAPQVGDFTRPDSPGLLDALAQGSGVVGASFIYKGVTVSATADFNVNPATVTGLRVLPTSMSLPAGTNGTLVALARFSDGSERNVTAGVAWAVANPAIVAMQQRGQQLHNLQALAVGQTSVTARFAGFSASSSVVVTNASLVSVSLSPQDAVLSAGVQVHYQLLARYSDGAEQDVTASALFTSSDQSVAVIEASGTDAGLATAMASGSSQIGASYGGLQTSGKLTVVAENLIPQSLAISPVSAKLLVGSQLQYRAVLSLSNGDQQDVTRSVLWESSAPGIAAIDSGGLALGVAAGTSNISARLANSTGNDLVANAAMVVNATAVTIADFYIEPAQTQTLPGTSVQFLAWVITSDGQRYDVTRSVTWQSSNPAIAGISGKGKVQALAVGDVQIQAGFSYSGQTYSDSASLAIIAPAITELNITPNYAEIVLGQQLAYVATARLAQGVSVDVTTMVSWSSSNPAVASISAAGLATSLAGGSTDIGASLVYQGVTYSATADLLVDAPVPELTALILSPQNSTVIAGQQINYQCQAVFSDGSIYEVTTDCQWSTAATNIAVIDALTGELTAVAEGITTVSASFTYQGSRMDASTKVTVLKENISLQELQVTPAEAQILPGTTQEFQATALLSDGRTLDVSSNVIWQSEDETIASVSAKGTARGHAVGQSRISATLTLASGTWSDSGLLDVVLPDVEVTQFRILPARKVALPGTNVTYRAQLVFADGTELDVSTLSDWAVADTTVAEMVNNRGEVWTLSAGNTQVAASLTMFGASFNAAAELVVVDPESHITGLELQPDPARLLVGGNLQMQAFIMLTNGQSIDVTTLGQWAVADETIATVDSDGLLTGISAGVSTVAKTLKSGSKRWSVSVAVEVDDPVALAELRVTPLDTEAVVGTTVQYKAVAVFTDGGSLDVTADAGWSVADPAIADVADQAGRVLALSAGTTQVSATYTAGSVTLSDSTDLTVVEPDIVINSFYLVPATQVTTLGGEASYRAILEYSDGSTQDVTEDAVWLSGTPSVAQLTDVPGQFVALAVGTTVISASIELAGGPPAATGSLEVSNKIPQWIEMSPWSSDVLRGQKTRFAALMHYDDGSTGDVTEQVAWSSATPSIAMVNNTTDKGVVAGISVGQALINVVHPSGLTATAGANVLSAPLLSIELQPVSASISVGDSQTFRAIGHYSGGYQFDITDADQIFWFSNAPHIADVISNGVVQGVSEGQAIITVGLGNITNTAVVDVTPAN